MQLISKYNKESVLYHNIHFVIFSPNPSPLYYLLKKDQLWKERAAVFLKKRKRTDIAVFEPIGEATFGNTHVLTGHVNKAISETQIAPLFEFPPSFSSDILFE